MQQLHNDITLCILIEYHLQIGCHRDNDIHRHALSINTHQRQQAIQIGVVAETEVCTDTITGNGRIGVCLYLLPK